ncbi:MAG: hypothetical protein ACI4I2_01985 [Oscillospiraceae bacterium]
MTSTLILLYALNASNPIPTGCFVAAWALFITEGVCGLIRFVCSLDKDR